MEPLLKLMHDHAGRSCNINDSTYLIARELELQSPNLEKIKTWNARIKATLKEINTLIDNYYTQTKSL